MKKLFFLFFCAIAANMAPAQFTVFSNPAYLPDVDNDSAVITAEVFASGPYMYFPKIKKEGTSTWINQDTAFAVGNQTVSSQLSGLTGNTKYYYEFTIVDTATGLPETSSDGYSFITEPDPAQTQITSWTITPNATTALFDVYSNNIGHTDSMYVEYGPTSGAGFPYKTSSVLVTGANQHTTLTAYGLLPHTDYRARVRSVVVGNIPGLQPVITQQKLFTTDSLSSVEPASLAVSVNWQDSVKVNGLVTLGSPSQASYKVELLTANLQFVDSTPFKNIYTNTAFTEMLHGTAPAGNYVIRLMVKDALGKDTLIISHTAAQVPLPTAALLPIVVSKHNGTLTVSATSNGSANWPGSQTTIKVEWGAIGQGGLSQYADSSTGIIAQTSHNFTLGTFPASTLVAYKVTVYNGAGVGFTYTGSFTTSAPFAPASGSINQNWNGSGAVGFTDWSYATATGDTALVTIEELLPGTTTVVDTMVAGYFTGSGIASDTFSGRTPGTTRDYRLKLRNTDGIISYSNVVAITTQDPNVPEFLVVIDSSYYFADIRIMGDGGGYNNSLNVEITHQGTVVYEVSGMPIQNGPIDQLLHIAPLTPGTIFHAKITISNDFYGDFSKEFDFFTKYDATGLRDLAGGDGPKNYNIYNDNILNPELLGTCKECTKDDLRIEYQKYAGQKIFVKPEGGSGYQVYIGK